MPEITRFSGLNRLSDDADIQESESPDCSNCSLYREMNGTLGPRLGKFFTTEKAFDDRILGFFPGTLATGRRWIVSLDNGEIIDSPFPAYPTGGSAVASNAETATFSSALSVSVDYADTFAESSQAFASSATYDPDTLRFMLFTISSLSGPTTDIGYTAEFGYLAAGSPVYVASVTLTGGQFPSGGSLLIRPAPTSGNITGICGRLTVNDWGTASSGSLSLTSATTCKLYR